MPLTLLQIVRAAQAELGLPQTSSVIGSTDATTVQMLALANRCLDELRRCNPTGWTALQFEYNIAIPVPIITTGDLSTAYTAVIDNIPDTSALSNAYSVSGPSLLGGARILTVDDAVTVTMNMEGNNNGPITNATFTFSQDTVPEPAGFDWFQNQTMWDRTNSWRLLGPDSPQKDQWHRSGIVQTGPRRHFRQSGPYANNFRIWPPTADIATPLQLEFEYISSYAIRVAGSAIEFAQYWANDTDTCLLDDQAVIMGIKWMFWEIKGMGSYVTLQGRWVDYVDRLIARDGAAPTLQLVKSAGSVLISTGNIQDSDLMGPTGQPV